MGIEPGPSDPGARTEPVSYRSIKSRWVFQVHILAAVYSKFLTLYLATSRRWTKQFLSYRVKGVKLHGYTKFVFKNIKPKSNSIFGRNPMATLNINYTFSIH